jgi:hypothetical protein
MIADAEVSFCEVEDRMEKARRPHVIRTWKVERIRVPNHLAQHSKLPAYPALAPPRRPGPHPPFAAPEK